jgi:hypothetical protein
MGGAIRNLLWTAIKYVASLIPGTLFIAGLVYVYVVRQCGLITHPSLFWVLVIAAVVASMLLSLIESALMTIHSAEHATLLEERATQLMNQRLPWSQSKPNREYREQRLALLAEIQLVSEASERNAPIVVLNHLVTILLGAALPITREHSDNPVFSSVI